MRLNVGGFDRILRIVVGLFIISLAFWGPQSNWGWIGLIPLLSGIFSFCPTYLPFKFSTRKQEGETT